MSPLTLNLNKTKSNKHKQNKTLNSFLVCPLVHLLFAPVILGDVTSLFFITRKGRLDYFFGKIV